MVSCPNPSAAGSCAPESTEETFSAGANFKIKCCKFIRAATTTTNANGTQDPNDDGGRVTLKIVEDVEGWSSDDYSWTLTNNIVPVDNSGAQTIAYQGSEITVRALNTTGPARVTATRNSDGEYRTVVLRIARITFSGCDGLPLAVTSQATNCSVGATYGFDDMKPPPDGAESRDPTELGPDSADKRRYSHISIESEKETHVHVKIEGAVGSDFNFKSEGEAIFKISGFKKSDQPALLPAAPETDNFVVMLNAEDIPDKAETLLRVRCKAVGHNNNNSEHTCADSTNGEDFAKLGVHVYKRKVVNVLIVKVWDDSTNATKAATALPQLHDTENYASAAFNADALNRTKGAVLEFNITNDPPLVSVPSFADDSGALVYEIGVAGNGPGLGFIRQALSAVGGANDIKIVLVKEMKSAYRLDQPVAAGAQQIIVKTPPKSVFIWPNNVLKIGSEYVRFVSKTPATGAGPTTVTIQSIEYNFTTQSWEPRIQRDPITKNPILTNGNPTPAPGLQHGYLANKDVGYSGGGWASDPVVVSVTASGRILSPDEVKAVILHEAGHKISQVNEHRFLDVTDADPPANATNIMNFTGGRAKCLRYLPRLLTYDNSTGKEESQWEKIQRP